METKDILKYFFDLQKQFQESIGIILPTCMNDIISKQNVENIKNQLFAMVDEVMEASREIPWKAWKKNQNFHVHEFRMELIDILHFLINTFILVGMEVSDVENYFLSKHATNIKRQEDGY